MQTLRFLMSDQLNLGIASLKSLNINEDVVLLCETHEEATYVKHHRQKLIFIFSAMRHFAKELEKKGANVCYVKIDDPANLGSLDSELERAISIYQPQKIALTFPGEYRLLQKFQKWQKSFNIEIEIHEDNRFFCSVDEFKEWAGKKPKIQMEYFYRWMRKKHNILLTSSLQPMGGRWNFDSENRQPIQNNTHITERFSIQKDKITHEVIKAIAKYFPDHFGEIENFNWAVTRKDALKILYHFIDRLLPSFGEFQDAMDENHPFLFHSLLSPYINAGLLFPKEVCQLAEKAYELGKVKINSAEGFIRQILGWREYMRGVYWHKMPNYAELNFFQAQKKLPKFYWDAKTGMNCLHQVIKQTQNFAYSHHIQRLMVTGNFALLAGADPKEVCEWYLIVYIDAYDWVELPNTLGMSLFGDGGYLASKPYAASGKYIHRMSNFCDNCNYNPNLSVGEKACPFNSLYWHFMYRHKKILSQNHRLKYTYLTWEKMPSEKRLQILEQAETILKNLDKDSV